MKKEISLRNGHQVMIRTLTFNELEMIMELQEKVIASLTVASFLQPLSEEEFRFILNGKRLHDRGISRRPSHRI